MKINPVSGFGAYQSYIRPLKFSVDHSAPAGYTDHGRAAAPAVSGRDYDKARDVADAYNRIASRYYGETVAYGSAGEAKGYEAEGRVFDRFV